MKYLITERQYRLLNEEILYNSLLKEFSDKLVQKLMGRFTKETTDSQSTILSYIDDFEKYKSTLPVEQRNIDQYSYDELKNLINPKRLKSDLRKYLTQFKKTTKGIPADQIITTLRKYFEIKNSIPENEIDIDSIRYLDLVGYLEKNFEKIIGKLLIDKFKKDTDFSNEQIIYYVNQFLNVYEQIPHTTALVADMSGTELEHLIDGLSKGKENTEGKEEIKNIDLVYDQNNLKIFAPKTKDQCILLRHGRSWCTSRDGSSNLYYNYRLNKNLTLYYVINEDLPYSDVNFASVILVDEYGDKRLADGTNSGRFSGHDVVSWAQIVKKIPKLKNLENLFKPNPLTQEELKTLNRIKNTTVGNFVVDSFGGNEKDAELWLELKSPTLSDRQFESLTPNLQKKYISLGFDLTTNQVKNLSPEAMKYYISRKIDSLKNKSLSDLTSQDITLLNTSSLSKLKESLKNNFFEKLKDMNSNNLDIEDITNSDYGKYISLYGFDVFFDKLPSSLDRIKLVNKSNQDIKLDLTSALSKFKNITVLFLDNCIEFLPDTVCQLDRLQWLGVPNNDKLTSIPECVQNLNSLKMVNLEGSGNLTLPTGFEERFKKLGTKQVWVPKF